ncbi:MAG: diguanylate cyclase (GGDEF)-like protein [Gammaproteobacteria bacterium]|jgi:diguanylate cyclase (GGDEF)-like protein
MREAPFEFTPMNKNLDPKLIADVVYDLVRGNEDALIQLTEWGDNPTLAPGWAHLCEQISHLALQSEAQHMRLEKMLEDLLEAQADIQKSRLDAVTGLPNRSLFYDRLESWCKETGKDGCLSLLFIDLDNFKNVNDSMGHDAGDHLLLQVSKRIQHELRESDFLSRFGGDEFTVILPNLKNEQEATEVAFLIRDNLNQPFRIQSKQVNISCSIGVSFFPKDANKAIQLLKNSDIAMYMAKERGRNRVAYFGNPKP